jgi:uncharacterized protein involved in outer membrane biogenesis
MGCMKKALLVGGGLVAALLLLVFGYAAHLLGSLNTPEFKKALLERAKASVGAEVQVKDMQISVLSGVTLKGVTVVNPAPFPGNLLTADALVLRYRLWPLLSGQVEVERLALVKPVLTLAMDGRGVYNYEKLAGTSAGGGSKAGAPAAVALPIELLLKQLAVENARIVMQDQTKATLLKVDDVGLDSAFRVAAAGAQGSGKAKTALVNVADMMFLRDVSAPLEMSKESVKLSPIRARLAEGDVTGDVTVNLKDGFRFAANLDVKGAHLKKLLEEAKSKPFVTGTLVARASFQGSGGLPTMKGKGRLEVTECKVQNAAVLGVVAAALRMPALANPDFDQCLVEFTMAGSRVQTPVVSLKGKQIQITGHGTTNLDTSALDYDLTLALAKEMLDKIGVRELRAAFKDRGDGFSAVDFKVTGTSSAPQTNLAAKVGAAAATEAAVGGLKKLFGKKKAK